LTTFRFTYTVIDPIVEIDEETGETVLQGGIAVERKFFPELDV